MRDHVESESMAWQVGCEIMSSAFCGLVECVLRPCGVRCATVRFAAVSSAWCGRVESVEQHRVRSGIFWPLNASNKVEGKVCI